MQLTIDNLDGLGPIDYSASIDSSEPFAIERTLNAPSVLKGMLCLAGSSLATPVRRARVVVTSQTGTTLFTGYLTVEPVPLYAGEASAGPVYRLALSAVSDEWLLDKQTWATGLAASLNEGAGDLVNTLATRTDAELLLTSGLSGGANVGVFEPIPGSTWSTQAGAVASAAYTSYRALAGSVALTPLNTVQHPFSDGDGTLSIAALKTSSVRELANDITVTGAEQPSTYWTEFFTGDGTTSVFSLLGQPDAPNAGHSTLLAEPFDEPSLNLQTWQLTDPGAHLSLTSAGLTFTGGNGLDGQTTLIAWDQLELGGSIILELGSVSLATGSAGVLGGLYDGVPVQANCFAGFNIRQSSGATLATPLIAGIEAGTGLTITPGHAYTLRLRLHCPELLRIKQIFYALVDTGSGPTIQQFGGGLVDAPISLVFEARDQAAASNTPATVLYDGIVSSSPAKASVVAVNSLSLSGSLGAIDVTQTGTCWVRSTSSTGTQFTRLIGKAADGADCAVTSSLSGHVTFFAGRIPAAGEIVSVSYRGRGRAVARVADPASIATEAAGGAVGSNGTARWLGHVVQPPSRSDEDCENAAQAILSFAANRAAAVSGSYIAVNPPTSDIWPGDVLVLSANGSTLNAIVRRVIVSEQGASPETLTYRIAFANDWAEGIGLKLSETIAKDAFVPASALALTSGSLPTHVLANLQQLTIATASGSLTVDAGQPPPSGGGFEVRRRDGAFGTGLTGTPSGDLVLRSPVRGFSIPVSAPEEAFFLRMFDASTPTLYSRYSTAILNHQTGS